MYKFTDRVPALLRFGLPDMHKWDKKRLFSMLWHNFWSGSSFTVSLLLLSGVGVLRHLPNAGKLLALHSC